MFDLNFFHQFKSSPSPIIDNIFKGIDVIDKPLKKIHATSNSIISDVYPRHMQSNWQVHLSKEAYKYLCNLINKYYPSGFLALGGSVVNELGTHNSDLDLCLSIKCDNGIKYDESVASEELMKLKWRIRDDPLIRSVWYIQARVPILNLSLNFPFNDVKVDINCNCVAGIYNTHLLFYYSKIDERVKVLAVVLKIWSKNHYVVSPKNGKLNSYTVVLMLIHFLQCGVSPPILPNLYALYPDLFNGTKDVESLDYKELLEIPKIPKNERTVSELIFGFFNYYAQFNYHGYGISIKKACVFDRQKCHHPDDSRYLFYLEEAYDGMTVPKNLTRKHKLQEILDSFVEGRERIYHSMGFKSTLDTTNDYAIPPDKV